MYFFIKIFEWFCSISVGIVLMLVVFCTSLHCSWTIFKWYHTAMLVVLHRSYLTKLFVLAGDQLRCDTTSRIILSRSVELHWCSGRIMCNCFTSLKVGLFMAMCSGQGITINQKVIFVSWVINIFPITDMLADCQYVSNMLAYALLINSSNLLFQILKSCFK